jgi:hypothetical protein
MGKPRIKYFDNEDNETITAVSWSATSFKQHTGYVSVLHGDSLQS